MKRFPTWDVATNLAYVGAGAIAIKVVDSPMGFGATCGSSGWRE